MTALLKVLTPFTGDLKMADKKKFERMLELLIAEDRKGAEELFHEIVVEQSRTIYETILEDDLADDEEVDEATDEEVDESDDDEEVDEADDEEVDEDDEDLDEGFDLDEFEVEADPADDMMGDVEFGNDDDEEGEDDPFGGDDEDEGEEDDVEDRVEDLEDALEDLKAEFDKIMGGGDDEDEMDMDSDDEDGMDMGDEEGDEDETEEGYENFAFEDEDEDEEVDEHQKSASETMREYVEKVGKGGGLDHNGELKSEAPGANTKSSVAGKNDMGGTASNINQSGTEAGVEANKGNIKGAALNDQNKKEDSHGNVNVPGGKAAKSMKPMPKGHGTEKKGAAETAPDKKSLIGSKK